MTDDWQATDPSEPEPLVKAAGVAKAINRAVLASSDDEGESVAEIAARARLSPRTIYRVLAPDASPLSLKTADHLLVACGAHISECELVWPTS